MELIKLSKTFLITIIPLFIFLSAAYLAGFSGSFYKEEFSKYNVEKTVPKALELHHNVIDYIKGRGGYLPDNFNEREKKHLHDVKRLFLLSKAALYSLIALAGMAIILSSSKIGNTSDLRQLIGKVLSFGGLLTIAIAALLFLLINSNFSFSFESFHKIFFQPGTYAFDPEYEIIVNLYPEGLFMDLGLRIAKFTAIASFIFIAIGAFLIYGIKKNK